VRTRLLPMLLTALFVLAVVLVWQAATQHAPAKSQAKMSASELEYAALMGAPAPGATDAKVEGFPTPSQFAASAYTLIKDPFRNDGPNDKGIGIQLAYSLGRVAIGFALAVLFAIPFGFLIGMSPLLYRALDPIIQILKPISPLAWMPIALYTIKDSTLSSIFVIFICSIWPMLINTAFGVASVRAEWLNVARTLEVKPMRRAFRIMLPAAAPTILTGMRISMGIAWLVIVAAEMLVGGTGIGYFVWNQWNNLSLANVIFAVLLIGVTGMVLDLIFTQVQKKVTYAD
jgi:nitrate/nitrite transport system permease protein